MKKIVDFKSVRGLVLAVFYYTSGAIFGPLLVLGGLGYLIDSYFSTNPIGLVIGIFIAFLCTNFLLYKKVTKINNLVAMYSQKNKADNSTIK